MYLQLAEGVDAETIRSDLSKLIEADGYKLVEEKSEHAINWTELIIAGAFAIVIVGIFMLFLVLPFYVSFLEVGFEGVYRDFSLILEIIGK